MTEGIVASKREAEVYALLATHTTKGLTVREVEDWLGIGHGPASSALSMLHRSGRVARLMERRRGQRVYVLRGYVAGREETSSRPRRSQPHPKHMTKDQVMAVMMDVGVPEESYPDIRKVLNALP